MDEGSCRRRDFSCSICRNLDPSHCSGGQCWAMTTIASQYDFQKKYAVMPAPTSTTNMRIHVCGIFSA